MLITFIGCRIHFRMCDKDTKRSMGEKREREKEEERERERERERVQNEGKLYWPLMLENNVI